MRNKKSVLMTLNHNYGCFSSVGGIAGNYCIQLHHHKNTYKMLKKNLDTNYFITYSNFFEIEGKTFAFRRKELFDITFVPKYMDLKNNNNCFGYWINRKWVSLSKIKDMIVNENKVVDVSNLQWYAQINLDYVFNLKTPN